MLVTSKPSHKILGFVPELNYVLLRDNETNTLELWTRSRGIALRSVTIDGHELEFVREAKSAVRIPDTEYNRTHCPHEIGRIYVDDRPLGAEVQVL
jgi:hypothetical protein